MTSLIVESSRSPARTPAWRKLGLKLKFDSGTASYVSSEQQPQSPKPGKKRPLPDGREALPGKMPCLLSSGADENDGEVGERLQNTEEFVSESPVPVASTKQIVLKSALPESTPRKSVSFTPGTKEAEDDTSGPEPLSESDVGPSAPDEKKAKKRIKRAERSENRSMPNLDSSPRTPASFSSTPAKTDSLRTYLTIFYKCRRQWKFQKKRETQLLKHALSLDRIPATENTALGAYLASLKNEAAKKRIAAVAVEAIQRDEEDIHSHKETTSGKDDGSVTRKVYQDAVTSFKRQLAEGRVMLDNDREEGENSKPNVDLAWLARLETRKRAELVIFFTGGRTTGEGSGPTDKQASVSIKKKRKNRTAVVLDETSTTSGSNSESEGEGDGDAESHPTSEPRSRQNAPSNSSTCTLIRVHDGPQQPLWV